MEVNKILSADILDIIFEGRNKEYGAYELRKTYNKRLTYALLGTAGFLLLMFLIYFLANTISANSKKEMIVQDVQLEDVKEEKRNEPPPPPPPPPAPGCPSKPPGAASNAPPHPAQTPASRYFSQALAPTRGPQPDCSPCRSRPHRLCEYQTPAPDW